MLIDSLFELINIKSEQSNSPHFDILLAMTELSANSLSIQESGVVFFFNFQNIN